MVNYQIAPNQYVLPTPGGAYYAVSSPVVEPARELLFRLFQEDHTPRLTAEQVQAWGELGRRGDSDFRVNLSDAVLGTERIYGGKSDFSQFRTNLNALSTRNERRPQVSLWQVELTGIGFSKAPTLIAATKEVIALCALSTSSRP